MRRERIALQRQAIGLRQDPPQLVLQLLDARPLDLRRLVGRSERTIELLPALLPLLQLLLGGSQRLACRSLGCLYELELRFQACDLAAQAGRLALIALDVGRKVVESAYRLGQIGTLPLAQL